MLPAALKKLDVTCTLPLDHDHMYLLFHLSSGDSTKRSTFVTCDAVGRVVVCGNDGTVLIGTKDEVIRIEGEFEESFYGLALYRGEVFVSSAEGLYKLVGSSLQPVDFGDARPSSFWRVTANETHLVSYSRSEVWEQIV
ncbi:hypothetical protein ACFL6C_09035 [Myxococcota bacterium]